MFRKIYKFSFDFPTCTRVSEHVGFIINEGNVFELTLEGVSVFNNMPREVVEIPTDSPEPIEWVSKQDADGRFVLGVIIGVAVGMLVCGAIIFLVPC